MDGVVHVATDAWDPRTVTSFGTTLVTSFTSLRSTGISSLVTEGPDVVAFP